MTDHQHVGVPIGRQSQFAADQRPAWSLARRATLLVALMLCAVRGVQAQSETYSLPVEKHAREFALTTGFGRDLPGGTSGGNYWITQIRIGRTLLAPNTLHGALEAAIELEPAMVLHQGGFIYGAGFTPVMLQWNFATRGRVIPFINAGGGILLTSAKFPRETTHFNFTPPGGIGAYIFTTSTKAWVVGARLHHTSSAGLTLYNPGHNALYIFGGISWWK